MNGHPRPSSNQLKPSAVVSSLGYLICPCKLALQVPQNPILTWAQNNDCSDTMHAEEDTPTTPHPYGVGTILRIREHLPPKPFTGGNGPSPRRNFDWHVWREENENKIWWEMDRVKFALDYPPIETDPPSKLERTLTITGSKTRRTSGGAHVLTCFLDGQPVEYVAKIYDGAHYPMDPNERGHDCMTAADLDYSLEALAYSIIQPVIGGTVVPAYSGSWTFALDTNQPGQQRWVCMILIELVQGECMLDIILRADNGNVDYALLPRENFRTRVLQNMIDAESMISWEVGISHNDIEPRNVIVKPDGSVVIVDFNQAETNNYKQHAMKQKYNPTGKPPSPIPRYWSNIGNGKGRWRGWMPERWLEDEELGNEWLILTYQNVPKYMPPSQYFLDKSCHEGQSRKILDLLEELGRKPAGSLSKKE